MLLEKKKTLVFSLFLLVILASFLVAIPSYAIDFSAASSFIDNGANNQSLSGDNLKEIGASFSAIGKVLIYIGAGITVIGLSYLGIMYLISPPEKQGKLKQQLIGLLVSALVIFGAFKIWSIIVNILETTIN